MIVYSGNKQQFLSDVLNDVIAPKIESQMLATLHMHVGAREQESWRNSMQYMSNVLQDADIPQDCTVAIEFAIPQTSKRVDIIITGLDIQQQHQAVIVELKQWTAVQPIADVEHLVVSDSVQPTVLTVLGRGLHAAVHPSYQAWTYQTLLQDFNSLVQDIPIGLHPCAYLHNYKRVHPVDPLTGPQFSAYIEQAPVYCSGDALELRRFIKQFITYGDNRQTLVYIDKGEIRPSKSLQDSLVAMVEGKKEFTLIDEQEVVFRHVLAWAKKSAKDHRKRVCIIQGGPGTGKTVVAINLLVELIRQGQYCAYVTKNSAPRHVFEAKLVAGKHKKTNIKNLFKGSGAFVDAKADVFGTLLVDESHRLNRRTALGPRVTGENQVKEIISASRCSVFFIDEHQQVTGADYGSIQSIRQWAKHFDAEVLEGELPTQFRCNGSDGYLAWLDFVLGIRTTANRTLEGIDFDFRVVDDPCTLAELIREKNAETGKARLVAGYCWEWVSKNGGNLLGTGSAGTGSESTGAVAGTGVTAGTSATASGVGDNASSLGAVAGGARAKAPVPPDIVIGDFAMRWNLSTDATYAISPGSIDQVGCIHTVQGLEFSHVGVIIGLDLRFQHGTLVTDYDKRAKSDKSLNGLLGPARKGDADAAQRIDRLIRNTYRTLMTRGMKGCYVYCCDPALRDYLRKRIG